MNFESRLFVLFVTINIMVITSSFGQNMVSNPSFETYSSLPSSPAQWSRATGWSNVNGGSAWPSSSPDYCHALGSGLVQLPNTVFGTVNAYHGDGVMGFITYYPSTLDFREYVATQLTSPMTVGTTYTVSFYITNGVPVTIGGMGILDFGVALSTGSLTQVSNEPINVTPQFTTSAILYNTTWRLITFDIVATQPWDHITFGNFENDLGTTSQVFTAVSSPGAYYFLDSVSVTEATILLPIDLLEFNALATDEGDVELRWTSVTETNNDYYTIERSQDGLVWDNLAKITGAGNSTETLNYTELDRNPLAGISYYRLKQTDLNGDFEYSKVRAVNLTAFDREDMLVYPCPTNGEVTIRGNELELSEIKLYNQLGQDLTKIVKIQTQGNRSKIDLTGLSSGIYILKTRTATHKIHKQ
jgi:hypothetical protein